MKEQKFLLIDREVEVNSYLDDGWEIVSVTAESVATGTVNFLRGKFAVVIQREKQL